MSYHKNFYSETNIFTNLLNFITFDLDFDPWTQIYRETWVPVYPSTHSLINELTVNYILFNYDDDYEYNNLVKDSKIDPNVKYTTSSLNVANIKKCLKYTLTELWNSSFFSKSYKFKITQSLNKNEVNFKWIGDKRFDIESIAFLTFQILIKHYDRVKNMKFIKFKTFDNFEIEFKSFNIYLINEDLSTFEFAQLLKLLNELINLEIMNSLYFKLINYKIYLRDIDSSLVSIAESKESDDDDKSGVQLTFIVIDKKVEANALSIN